MAPLCSWLGKPSMAPPLFREVAAARERPAARGSSSLLCERLRARVTVDGMSYFFLDFVVDDHRGSASAFPTNKRGEASMTIILIRFVGFLY